MDKEMRPEQPKKFNPSSLPDQKVLEIERIRAKFCQGTVEWNEYLPVQIVEGYLEGVEETLNERLDGELIRQAMRECESISERDVFFERMIVAIDPLIEDVVNHRMLEGRSFALSNVLDISIEGDDRIGIHIASNLKPISSIKSFSEGKKILFQIVLDNPSIQVIEAATWIWKKYPKFADRMGFTIVGPIPNRIILPEGEKRENYLLAEISRDAFLEKNSPKASSI